MGVVVVVDMEEVAMGVVVVVVDTVMEEVVVVEDLGIMDKSTSYHSISLSRLYGNSIKSSCNSKFCFKLVNLS